MKTYLYEALFALAIAPVWAKPFLQEGSGNTWIIGNDLWNLTQGTQYATSLYYNGKDLVGNASGHYTSSSPTADYNWTSAAIVNENTKNRDGFIDIKFASRDAELHWVIFDGLAGAYQYIVNVNLPTITEFRTVWRLDNSTFTHVKTPSRQEELPPLAWFPAGKQIQDETWERPDGKGYLTKYNYADFVRSTKYYGVYGNGFGSWYIRPGNDYLNGHHLKQELMIHRETKTGDVVLLNMLQGSHFMIQQGSQLNAPAGRVWGPWLWYLNDGSIPDVQNRVDREANSWPYAWLQNSLYQSRGGVRGRLRLSDGRAASGAAVYLGDNNPTNPYSLYMGSRYTYTAYTDLNGYFEIPHVHVADSPFSLQAWSNGTEIGDVDTTFLKNDVAVVKGETTNLGDLEWAISKRARIFQVGDFDRLGRGFAYAGSLRRHGASDDCPADIEFVVGQSSVSDWCYAQAKQGTWTIRFDIKSSRGSFPEQAVLIVSLAGYSTGTDATVSVNGNQVSTLKGGTAGLLGDQSVYRSANLAGEWRKFEFNFNTTILEEGSNKVEFSVTKSARWRGFLWDSIILEW